MRLFLMLATVGILANLCPGFAQAIVPDTVGFKADSIRSFLPVDGKLHEQGVIGKDYIGFALGHEVMADGKKVVLGPKLEGRGVEFGDGYLAINLGAHFEVEKAETTFAFNATARIYLKIEEGFKVVLSVDEERLKVVGDNLGGKAAVAVGREKIKDVLRRELSKLGDKLTSLIQEKLPAELKKELKHVVIHAGGIDVLKTKPTPKPAADFIVSAKMYFHTTTDDKEGGIVTIEFFSDEKNQFAAVPAIRERVVMPFIPPFDTIEPNWPEKSRKEFVHTFPKPIPVPEKIGFARINLTEGRVINVGWNFNATIVLKTANGKEIVFEGANLRLDTTGKRRPATDTRTIPKVR